MTITFVESSNTDSFHPLHIQLPPQTTRVNRHSYHARFPEREQKTVVARTRSDFLRGSTSVTPRLESIVRPCSVSQLPLEKCVSRHNVLSGPSSNVQSQFSCCSLNTLMCSFNCINTLVLCTVDWFQDGRTWMTECSDSQPTVSSQVHCRISVSCSQPSIFPQMKTMTSLRNYRGSFRTPSGHQHIRCPCQPSSAQLPWPVPRDTAHQHQR